MTSQRIGMRHFYTLLGKLFALILALQLDMRLLKFY